MGGRLERVFLGDSNNWYQELGYHGIRSRRRRRAGVAGGIMALSGGGVARSLDCVSVLCVVASGGAPAADRVLVLPGVRNGVCRRSRRRRRVSPEP